MPPVFEGHSPSITFAGDSAEFPIEIPDDPVNTPTIQECFIGPLTMREALAQALAEIASISANRQVLVRSYRIFHNEEAERLGRFIVPPGYHASMERNNRGNDHS
ncbi:hypothetical protein PGTUg99_025979 [Puccinia graminis f. sp. tritici]|uniref:Uncharacterized protein n=2 Tax=Puccinia graminis f. sp. tritici TaxID=56615 RepID=E3KP63_PUCGT|nr:uncharacterized protein PGTG_12044 [Puccinia graminis f. sp. tritici CRL 75-36-700-3]EFP86088.2 hypothetical protein PGTG_12044 [Puccinia graminis f. sp. tritici CRL 75-36-700-3]KAA1113986.1 hypothetical protein PGTUg99_025979 [Puccinia graminis f. sp. tritici]